MALVGVLFSMLVCSEAQGSLEIESSTILDLVDPNQCLSCPWLRQRRQWHALQYSCLENPMDGGAW